MAFVVLDLLTRALLEIGAFAQGEVVSAEDSAFALGKLNDILDEWNARKAYVYNVGFSAFTLTPNLAPHTIGPTGTFVVTQRPVRIENAALILNTSTPNVDVPLNIRDDDWWANQRVKSLTSTVPTDLYYSPDWPNGALNFWPVPTFAYGVRLELWGLLTEFSALNTPVSLPPAYRKALTLTLAEELIPSYQSPMSGPQLSILTQKAMRARAAVMGNNDKSPRIQSADWGTDGRSRNRADFNYRSGMPS